MRPDDLILACIFFGLFPSILRSVRKQGGLKRAISTFASTAENGSIIILFLLAIPVAMLTIYYFAFILPGFRLDTASREAIYRPSIGTLGIILFVFFMNGRLVRAIRGFANWSVRQWNRFGSSQT